MNPPLSITQWKKCGITTASPTEKTYYIFATTTCSWWNSSHQSFKPNIWKFYQVPQYYQGSKSISEFNSNNTNGGLKCIHIQILEEALTNYDESRFEVTFPGGLLQLSYLPQLCVQMWDRRNQNTTPFQLSKKLYNADNIRSMGRKKKPLSLILTFSTII